MLFRLAALPSCSATSNRMSEALRVKFVTGDAEPDLLLHLAPTDTVEAVLRQIRLQKNEAAHKHLRIICAGKELYPNDLAHQSGSRVLHCMVTDSMPQRSHVRKSLQPVPIVAVEQPPIDWLDVVDPGTVLMWIFGSILALLWLLFVFYAHMFDRTSVIMLCMMSVAFLVPCLLSYLPGLSFLSAPSTPLGHAPDLHDRTSGMSTAVQPSVWNGQAIGSEGIPPRPAARVRPPVA